MTSLSKRIQRWVLPIIGSLLILLIWEICVRNEIIRSVFLPAPTVIIDAYFNNIGYLLSSAAITLRDIAIGYFPGCLLGISLGIFIGYYRSLNSAFAPLLLILSPIPIVTFLPLFIIWFGLNIIPVLACAFIAAFFPCLMSTISGVKNVEQTLIEVAQNFGATNQQMLRKVIFPAALPQVANGMRLSIQLCFLVTPVAEMIMGDIGLGGLIWRSADLFKTELVLGGQFTLGVMGLTLYKLFDHIEIHYLLPWRRPKE